MEILISKEGDMWMAHVGKYKFESPALPLVPASESLYRLVAAIHKTYPGSKIWIDPDISRNPFMHHALFMSAYASLIPDYHRVQYTLDNPEVKKCGMCGSEAWYNSYGNHYPHVGWWECSSVKCQAHQSPYGGWFRLSRHARKG